MSIIADFSIPAESFALEQTLAAESRTTVEAERLASHSAKWVFPFLWASGGDFQTFTEALQEDPTVAHATAIEKYDDSSLYKIQWSDRVINLIDEMIDRNADILRAKARGETWRLRLRFADEQQISLFQDYFDEREQSFTVNKLTHPTTPRQQEHGLTAVQRDTLVTAFREGYFTVPREITIENLADILDISTNAASQRIRRASATLIQATLVIETGEEIT